MANKLESLDSPSPVPGVFRGALMIVGRRKQHPYYRTGGVSFGTRHLATYTTGCINGSETGTELKRYVAGEDIDN